jgi:FkbM family methyltransferase
MSLVCPPSMVAHAQKVLRGEYDLPYEHPGPVILDIGANIGAFALWAVGRWPGCRLHCYEPLPANFELLRRNLAHLPADRVSLHPFAIGDPSRTRLFLGRNNCGESSFFDLGEQSGESVEVLTRSPDVLPRADLIKVDAEGSEVEILAGLGAIDADVVVLEYHSESNRRRVDALLADYVLVGGQVRCPHRGVMKYVHRRFFPARGSGGEAGDARPAPEPD